MGQQQRFHSNAGPAPPAFSSAKSLLNRGLFHFPRPRLALLQVCPRVHTGWARLSVVPNTEIPRSGFSRREWISAVSKPSSAQPSFSFVSSMSMSLNSLDSNTSPHSRHSTNSASSSRATTRTRGCLHGAMSFFCGVCCGLDGLISSGLARPAESGRRHSGGIGGIFSPTRCFSQAGNEWVVVRCFWPD